MKFNWKEPLEERVPDDIEKSLRASLTHLRSSPDLKQRLMEAFDQEQAEETPSPEQIPSLLDPAHWIRPWLPLAAGWLIALLVLRSNQPHHLPLDPAPVARVSPVSAPTIDTRAITDIDRQLITILAEEAQRLDRDLSGVQNWLVGQLTAPVSLNPEPYLKTPLRFLETKAPS